MDCLIDGARTVVCGDSYRDRRTIMKQIATEAIQGTSVDGAYYVSKAWYDCKLSYSFPSVPEYASLF